MLSQFNNISSPKVLDIGCGFGDLNKTLKEIFTDYHYTGIDITEDFINVAKQTYQNEAHIEFILDDFLSHEFTKTYDFAIASGTFNTKFSSDQNHFIEQCITKAFSLTSEGIGFDFLSDKVDFQHDHTHHASPEKILGFAYKHSRNLILLNNYIPFEFALVLFNDDSFTSEQTIFKRTPRF